MQCDQEVALAGFLSQVRLNEAEGTYASGTEGATLVAVLGGGCVTDSDIIVSTISAGQWKIPLVSPACMDANLKSKQNAFYYCDNFLFG